MRLSIVIALYNTEKFIVNCINSIYNGNNLDNSDFEVLVIDDGSTDSSALLVENLQKKYANLVLIKKENGGQSTARNIGFKRAKGEYIFCLDSDDFIDANSLLDALVYVEHQSLDMLPIFYGLYKEDFTFLKDKKDNYTIFDAPITGGEFMNKFVVSGSMWRYFYKTSLIKEHSIYLTEGIYHEDEEFIIKFLSYSNKVSYGRHQVYKHVVRSNSTVNLSDIPHRKRLLNDLIIVVKHLIIHSKDFDSNSLEYKGIMKKVEQLCFAIFLRLKKEGFSYNVLLDYMDKLEELGMYPLKTYRLNFKFKIMAKLFNNMYFNRLFFGN